jgi:hypothetical protein
MGATRHHPAMRQTVRHRIPSMLVLALVALSVPVAASAASGLPPTIAMNPEAAGPGAVVEIVGLDFPPDGAIELQVTTTAGPVSLGTTVATQGGYFRQAVTLPTDVQPGFWELRATGPSGATAVHIFEARTMAAGSAQDANAAAVAAASGPSPLVDPNLVVTLVMLLLLVVIVCAAVFVYGVTHRREGQPGMPVGDDPIWSGAGSSEGH